MQTELENGLINVKATKDISEMEKVENISNPSSLLVYSRRKQDKVMDPIFLSHD